MNMSKKIIILLLTIITFIPLLNVYAANDCSTRDVKSCNVGTGCMWNTRKNVCEEGYVANNPCSEPDILHIMHFFGIILLIAKILIPLLIVGFGTFDLFKAVTDKDEKSISKQTKILLLRVLSGLIVFFIPSIVYAFFGLTTELSTYQQSEYQACVDCLLKPTNGSCKYD